MPETVRNASHYYPGCPVDWADEWEVSEEEWETYCSDMEEMRYYYEKAVFGDD